MYMSSSNAGILFDSLHNPTLKKIISRIECDATTLNEIELIRLVYIRLGKFLNFNPKYRYLMSSKSQFAEETDAWEASRINDFSRITHKAICIDIESLFSMILTEMYGIPSNIVVDGSGPHVYLEVKTSDYGRIYCDLQQDLYNIKLDRKTEYFASLNFYNCHHYSKISENDLYLIDKKIQYVVDDKTYSNEIFEKNLADATKNVSDPITTAAAFFETMDEVYGSIIANMGYCEASEAYKLLAKQYVPELGMIHRTLRTTPYSLVSYFTIFDSRGVHHYFLGEEPKQHHTEVTFELISELERTNKSVHGAILSTVA